MLSLNRIDAVSWAFGSSNPPRLYLAQLLQHGDNYEFLIGRLLPDPFAIKWPTFINEIYNQKFYSRDDPTELVSQMLTAFKNSLDPDHPYELAYNFGGLIAGEAVKVITGGYDA